MSPLEMISQVLAMRRSMPQRGAPATTRMPVSTPNLGEATSSPMGFGRSGGPISYGRTPIPGIRAGATPQLMQQRFDLHAPIVERSFSSSPPANAGAGPIGVGSGGIPATPIDNPVSVAPFNPAPLDQGTALPGPGDEGDLMAQSRQKQEMILDALMRQKQLAGGLPRIPPGMDMRANFWPPY